MYETQTCEAHIDLPKQAFCTSILCTHVRELSRKQTADSHIITGQTVTDASTFIEFLDTPMWILVWAYQKF